jgi:hypothetical protein
MFQQYFLATLFACWEGKTCRIKNLGLVAGGGFVLQARIDATQVIDFPIGQNGQNGDKRKSFIQFSFSLFQTNDFYL